ncbi:MAG: TraB/GumN family protein [Burkholderiaceae bacterium]|nr:TraB/GumN family protein [Burkholderiaceae bacterium]
MSNDFKPYVRVGLAALYDALAAVVNRGDHDAIGPMVQSTYDAPEDGALVQRILLAERNAAWLVRLRTELDQGHAAVVVDVAHLGGADGLVALLN